MPVTILRAPSGEPAFVRSVSPVSWVESNGVDELGAVELAAWRYALRRGEALFEARLSGRPNVIDPTSPTGTAAAAALTALRAVADELVVGRAWLLGSIVARDLDAGLGNGSYLSIEGRAL